MSYSYNRQAGSYGPGFKAVKPPAGFKGVGQTGWIKKLPDGQVLTVDLYQHKPGQDHFKAYIRPKPGASGQHMKVFDSAAGAFKYVEKKAE